MSESPSEVGQRLQQFLVDQAGSDVEISNLHPLAGGASRAAYALDITVRQGPQAGEYPSVLRLDLGGKIYEGSLSRVEEFKLLRQVKAAGVAVPEALWASDDPAILGRDFVILERIEGETIGRRILKREDLAEARQLLGQQMGQQLAKIHDADPRPLDFLLRPEPGETPAAAALRRCLAELDKMAEPHPAMEVGRQWLLENAPACDQLVLVHGDFRVGNFIVGTEGLRGILDWEFATVGDPHEDLAWPFVRDWRFGNDALRLGGFSDGEDFLSAYEQTGGRKVNRRALHYWEVMGNFRWALGCLTQAHRHLSGTEPSVELASLGRRCAEMELEMLDLIAKPADGSSGR